MSWIPLVAWVAALVTALVVLGFCAYEINWKVRRLNEDLAKLTALDESLQEMQGEIAATQLRLARVGAS